MFTGYGKLSVCLFTLCLVKGTLCSDDEPRHCSRYHYDEKLLEKMIRMEIKMEELEKQIKELGYKLQPRTPNVAFRAMLGKETRQVTKGQKIAFDEVNLNRGNAYSAQDGVFTAPYNGTYLFSMALGNPGSKAGAFFLMQNGKVIEFVFAGHTSGWDMGGVTTVTELVIDDQVWVEGEGYVSGAFVSVRYHTSFSGALLHSDNLP